MRDTKDANFQRRITVTLPADSLRRARKIAAARHVTLSTVISELVASGLEVECARDRCDQILNRYRAAFAGFSEDELAILDGVILQPDR